MLNLLKQNYIFAVIRGKDFQDGIKIAEAAIEGGICNIEVTYTTPDASKVISSLSDKFKDSKNIIIGAGTVMNIETAKNAINSGAKFLVSPHFSQDIQKFSSQENLPYFPGCATTTEIVTALESGVKLIKIFPAGILGIAFIKDIRGPLPNIDVMPSGGVSLENIRQWKDAGACAVGLGGALTSSLKEKGYSGVTEMAKQFVNALKE